MSEGMTIEHAPSTNGRVYPEPPVAVQDADEDGDNQPTRGGIGRLLVPAALVLAGLIVLRRMQRGNYA